MSKDDSDYYLARVSAEREAAERATSEEVRRAHLQLAERYRQVLAGRYGNERPRDA
jgi:DNA-directed RNA polymerase specialized sigma subunit